MKQFISRNKGWLGYTLYCIILTAALLYYRFPSDALAGYLRTRINKFNAPLSLSIDRIKPWPPFGLKFGQTGISLKDRPGIEIFRTDSLLVSPEAWSFLKGKRKYRFKCLGYGGSARGCISFDENSTAAPFTTEIALENIRIGTLRYLKDLIGRDVDGILSGTISYSGQGKDLMAGTGEASLKLLEGRVELLFPILSLGSIDFHEVSMDMALKGQNINLTRFDLKGPQVRSTLSGTIGLKRDLGRSTLELKGRIEPFASIFKNAGGLRNTMRLLGKGLKKGAFSFIISGTIREPKIRFT